MKSQKFTPDGMTYGGRKARIVRAGAEQYNPASQTHQTGRNRDYGNEADPTTISHSSLLGLTNDDHSQYVLLTGRSTGQTIKGGNAASETLTLMSTGHATKGKILFGTSGYDEVNNRLGIGNSAPTVPLDVTGAMAITGNITHGEGSNIATGTATGSKICTTASQKVALWGATPIVQPTTAITAATFVANTSGVANDTATFDGYTIGQVVKALRNFGALA